MFEENFVIKPDLKVNIKRILSDELERKNNKFIPIQNSAFWDVVISFKKEECFLAKLYAGLTFLTGDGDSCYDNYKGSYSFLFNLNVKQNSLEGNFIYQIYHYRSYIEFSVNELACRNDPRNPNVYCAPNDELFSNKDITNFSLYFCGYVLGFMKDAKYTPKPFVKCSDSNLLLFGYAEDEYFNLEYEDYDEYLEIKKQICANKEP
ncbi:MAG: hypothetical protein K2Q14_02625 [Gammaproteobacteria bacterium]|nr:hypothetical protein [Gammaproteobacteria bacterium]